MEGVLTASGYPVFFRGLGGAAGGSGGRLGECLLAMVVRIPLRPVLLQGVDADLPRRAQFSCANYRKGLAPMVVATISAHVNDGMSRRRLQAQALGDFTSEAENAVTGPLVAGGVLQFLDDQFVGETRPTRTPTGRAID